MLSTDHLLKLSASPTEFFQSWVHYPCSCGLTVQAPDMLCCTGNKWSEIISPKYIVCSIAILLKFRARQHGISKTVMIHYRKSLERRVPLSLPCADTRQRLCGVFFFAHGKVNSLMCVIFDTRQNYNFFSLLTSKLFLPTTYNM